MKKITLFDDLKYALLPPAEGLLKRAAELEPLVSDCCFAPDHDLSEDGPSWSDLGRCPDCREHCEFVEEDDER